MILFWQYCGRVEGRRRKGGGRIGGGEKIRERGRKGDYRGYWWVKGFQSRENGMMIQDAFKYLPEFTLDIDRPALQKKNEKE